MWPRDVGGGPYRITRKGFIEPVNEQPFHLGGVGDGGPVMIIHTDGTIEMGKGYTPTEAGETFIKAMRSLGVEIRVSRIHFTHELEWKMPSCNKHFFKGYRWRCRQCRIIAEHGYRDVTHALWDLQGAGDRIKIVK